MRKLYWDPAGTSSTAARVIPAAKHLTRSAIFSTLAEMCSPWLDQARRSISANAVRCDDVGEKRSACLLMAVLVFYRANIRAMVVFAATPRRSFA
jgi:hypothetical protein